MSTNQTLLHHTVYQNKQIFNDTWVILIHGAGGNSRVWQKQLNAFSKEFHVITIDLPGHFPNKEIEKWEKDPSLKKCAELIMDVLNAHSINKAHFVGISLGSVIIHQLVQQYPSRIHSAVLGGMVTEFNLFSKALIAIGNAFKHILPYIWIYSIFAHIIMPRKHHRMSRLLFIREAKKMGKHSFLKWFGLYNEIKPASYQVNQSPIPRLYLSGSEDYLFIKLLNKYLKDDESGKLVIIPESGHVCNMEQANSFNQYTISFVTKHSAQARALAGI